MLYFVSPNGRPLRHISCGQLIHDNGFIHPERQIDSFVLIVGIRGSLCIYQDDQAYQIEKNQYLLLFPGHKHGGLRQSDSSLSYYWCHFKVAGNASALSDEKEMDALLSSMRKDGSEPSDYYILPEYGEIKSGERISLLFHQMLDNVSQPVYSEHMGNYALSLLATGITQEFLFRYEDTPANSTRKSVSDIKEWIRVNFMDELSVRSIAWRFGYNPNYLSTVFRKHTGESLVRCINKSRIKAAKQRLLETDDPVKTISAACGFHDEKHFMKTFKKYEGLTPTSYRNTFYKKHISH